MLARKSALSQLASKGQIKIVEDINLQAPKTKEFAGILHNLGLADVKTVIVTPAYNEILYKSGRNIPQANIRIAADLNTYDILNCKTLLLTESSIQKISETLS